MFAISPTFFIEEISPILNFILNSFSTAAIRVMCSRLSQSSMSFAVVLGLTVMLSSSKTSLKTLFNLEHYGIKSKQKYCGGCSGDIRNRLIQAESLL